MHPSIAAYLNECQPASLLECAQTPWPELQQWADATGVPLAHCDSLALDASERVDFALVHDALEHLSRPQGQQLLGYLRNCLAQRIWLLIPANSEWTLSDLIALGFRQGSVAPPEYRSYTYDIVSYNHKRSWNNSKFWANPQNFDKYRW